MKKFNLKWINFKLTLNFTNLTGFVILMLSCYNNFNNAGLTAGVSLMSIRKVCEVGGEWTKRKKKGLGRIDL